NGMTSRGKKQKENVSIKEKQKKQQPKVKKTKKVGSIERLALPKPSKPRNDHVAAIMCFDDLQWGNILITGVYFIKGLGYNLFSVGQFCDLDLEVNFRRNAWFVRNLEGVDLLKGNCSTNLYTINLHEMASLSPICLMARASTPRKSKRASHPPKPVPNSRQRLHLLHIDLYGPMRIANINGKWYVLVIVDDYSRYTWSPVIIKRTDNGTEFKNQVLKEYFDRVSISHQVSSVRTPQQNRVMERRNWTLVEATRTMALCYPKNDHEDIGKLGAKGDIDFFIGYSAHSCAFRVVVKRKNRTLVEAARTMFIFSHAPLFLWAEAIATACFTQNHSIIHRRFNKTPYELINGIKPDISFLHVFGALCYPKNDGEDIRKLGAKGLDLTYAPSTITTQQATEGDLDLLFEAMYDDYIGGQLSAALRTILASHAHQVCHALTTSTSIADSAATPKNSSSHVTNFPNTSQDVDELNSQQQHAQQQGNQAHLQSKTVADNVPNAMFDGNTFVNPLANPSTSAAESSSSQNVDPSNMHTFYQPYPLAFQ
nr:hypothetical protein [Tanacetum cinerariifolium]